jgi:hypothetical protein
MVHLIVQFIFQQKLEVQSQPSSRGRSYDVMIASKVEYSEL